MTKRTRTALAAGAVTVAGIGTAAHVTSAPAATATDAVRAVETASRGIAGRPYDLDRERNRWEIGIASGQERHVSLDGRKLLATRRDDDDSRDAARVAQARVSLAAALRTAAGRAQGTLTDAEIDTAAGGTLVWTVSFESSGDRETEVAVDARTGKVHSVRTEDDD